MRTKVTTLGAVTNDGGSLSLSIEDYLTDEHGNAFLQARVEEFGEKLCVFLARVRYFYAKDLWEFVSGERPVECVVDTSIACLRDGTLQVWYYPPRLPELNHIEQGGNRFKSWYKYRCIKELGTLKGMLSSAIASIYEPGILDYICP